jgi:hypothetical protein
LSLHELGFFECFGEDPDSASNLLISPEILAKRQQQYSFISSLPTEYLSMRKIDFYTYLDDVMRKVFVT